MLQRLSFYAGTTLGPKRKKLYQIALHVLETFLFVAVNVRQQEN